MQALAYDGAAAKAAAYREADGVVIGLSVFPGRISPLKDETQVTPLRGQEHTVTVTQVVVTEKKISIPSKCPGCRDDLRKPKALLCADLYLQFWQGHLTKDNDEVKGDRDQQHLPSNLHIANVARVQCAKCAHHIHWTENDA